jgi:hypothetical protein
MAERFFRALRSLKLPEQLIASRGLAPAAP